MKDVVGEIWPSRIVRLCAYGLTGLFAYLWVKNIDASSAALEDYQIAALFALGVGLSLFVFGFALNLLWLVPWEIWQADQSQIKQLGERLRPQIAFDRVGPQALTNLAYGHVHTSLAGTRKAIITDTSQGIALPVHNPGAIALTGVQAYLARFKVARQPEDESWQTLTLPWVPIEQQTKDVALPTGAMRSIWLFRVIGNRPQFMTTEMPINMSMILQDKGEYEGLIVLTAVALLYLTYPDEGP